MNTKNLKRVIIIGTVLYLILINGMAVVPAFADDQYRPAEEKSVAAPTKIPCIPNVPCLQEETKATAYGVQKHVLSTFASTFLTQFLGLCALTAVIFIIVGGTQMRLAFGNDEAVGKAKKTLIWAVAGLIISILSVGIVQIISNISLK